MSSGRARGSRPARRAAAILYRTQIMEGDLETKLQKWLLAAGGSIQ
jgi:hypothetical protein